MFTAALFTIARTWKQPRCPSKDEWIKKLWYIYPMEYYSAIKRNTFESVLVKWVNLEPIILSEVCQKEKNKYSVLTHVYGIKKMILMNIFAGKEWRRKCREWTCRHREGGGQWDKWKVASAYMYSIRGKMDGW